jgi:hypothetical protein
MNACGLEVFQQPPMIEVKSPLFVFVENGIGQPPILRIPPNPATDSA